MTGDYVRIISERTFTDENDNKKKPMYILIRSVADLNTVRYKYFHYVPQKKDYSMRIFLFNEALYIDFLRNQKENEFNRLLNSGKLYKTVTDTVRKAEKAVQAQVDKWALVDKELLLAEKNRNEDKFYGLFNNLKARAEEVIFPQMLYV